jgi:hypothetical protein
MLLLDGFRHLLQAFPSARANNHARTLMGKPRGHGLPQPFARSCHDRYAPA